jgi:hypothetical protein
LQTAGTNINFATMSATGILDLAKAGFTEAQVEALARYFDSQMATKADVNALQLAIEKVRADVELKIAALELKIVETKAEIIKWVVGLLIAQAALIVALIKLLPPH